MYAFLAAAALSALWFLVHVFVGGRQIAQPLRRATSLPPIVRDTQLLCWHFTSAAIAATTLFFGLAAFLELPAYAVSGTVVAAAFAVVGIGLIRPLGQSAKTLPQGWLFVPVAGLGLWGLLS